MTMDVRIWASLLAGALLIIGGLLASGPSLISPQLFAIAVLFPDDARTSLKIPAGPTGSTAVSPSAEETLPSPGSTSLDILSSPTVSGPPSFTLIVTPVEARARPGDPILYSMTIEPKGGFDQPVSLRIDVSALLVYRNSFDLGTVNPPYPRTFEYLFRVPSNVPGGIMVKGLLTAEGGGHRETQDLILLVGK
jgi:hypothetical protein